MTQYSLSLECSSAGCRDFDMLSEDYDAVDHRLQLFLDMEVFERRRRSYTPSSGRKTQLYDMIYVLIQCSVPIQYVGTTTLFPDNNTIQLFHQFGKIRFCYILNKLLNVTIWP